MPARTLRTLFAATVLSVPLAYGLRPALNAHHSVAPALSAPPARAQPTPSYNIYDLGEFGAEIAYDINNAGQVVGYLRGGGGFIYAVSNHRLTPLGSSTHTAYGINDSGTVVGTMAPGAFVWTEETGPQPLDQQNLPGATASAINASGAVVGYGYKNSAFIHSGGQTTNLSPLCDDNSCLNTAARDINSSGVIAGTMEGAIEIPGVPSGYRLRAFRSAGKRLIDPKTDDLGTFGGTSSMAWAVNDKGQIVGRAQDLTGSWYAFIWNGPGRMERAGNLGGESEAFGINNHGVVVGRAAVAGRDQMSVDHAYLWPGEGQAPIDLNTVLPADSGWELREARAINDAGQIVGVGLRKRGEDTVRSAFLLLPVVDLEVTSIEVTQAIQDLSNSVTLVGSKETYVRVHVRSHGADVDGVTAHLYGSRDEVVLRAHLEPENNKRHIINVHRNPRRAELNDSFYFRLPDHWTTIGKLTLRAEINPELPPSGGESAPRRAFEENNLANNTRTVGPLNFVPPADLKLTLVKVQYRNRDGKVVGPSDGDVETIYSHFGRMYPTNLTPYTGLAGREIYLYSPPLNKGNEEFFRFVNFKLVLNALNYQFMPGAQGQLWYGLVPDPDPNTRDGAAGKAGPASVVASGVNGRFPFLATENGDYGSCIIAAHEVGHLLGLRHVEGCGDPGNAHPQYPEGRIGGGEGEADRYFGFDYGWGPNSLLYKPRVIGPQWKDMMTYCENSWISNVHYEQIYRQVRGPEKGALEPQWWETPGTLHALGVPVADAAALPSPLLRGALVAAPAAPQETGDFLTVVGSIDLSAQVASMMFLTRLDRVAAIPPLAPGPYRLRLFGTTNALIAEHSFTPEPGSESPTEGMFALVVPFASGTRRIAVYSEAAEREIGSVPVSSHPPTVAVNSPSAGAALPADGTVNVTWRGSDPDGDALTYMVLYSVDGRASWHPVAVDVTADSATLDASELVGTRGAATGYFRVVANDGVLTGSAESGPFRVAGKAPRVRLNAFGDGDTYERGRPLWIKGSATDSEEGSLSGAALSWSSDRDGQLGTGAERDLGSLSLGTHTITLTATDSEGQKGTASAVINVVTELGEPGPTLSAGPAGMSFPYAVGGGASSQVMSIRNLGAGALAWTASSDAGWVTLGETSGTTPSNVTVTANTSGMPAGASQTAHITITAVGGDVSPRTVEVVAYSTAPAVEVGPQSVNFIDQQAGTGSPARAVTLRNEGAADVKIEGVTLTGANPKDFIKTEDSCSGVVVKRGQSCHVDVSFRPLKTGVRTGYLTFGLTGPGGPRYVALSGKGAGVVSYETSAWGDNGSSQLGSNVGVPCATGQPCSPTPVRVNGLSGVLTVSAGAGHNLALKTDGTVWAWGGNFYGQLGEGQPGPSGGIEPNVRAAPARVRELDGVVSVAAGSVHSLALKADGTVWAWGGSHWGVLGDGQYPPNEPAPTGRPAPAPVKGPEGVDHLTGVTALATGGSHNLALKSDGTVWAWGNNFGGQIGDGTSARFRGTPVQVKGPGGVGYLDGVIAVAAGNAHSLALRADGTVWAWGSRFVGQLGDGGDPSSQISTPVQVKGPGGVGQLTGVTAIAAGSGHNLALKADGSVWAWGSLSRGQIGDGFFGEGSRRTPVQVKGTGGVGFLKGVVAISAGGSHSLALLNDQTVRSWGWNFKGQLGKELTPCIVPFGPRDICNPTPVEVKGLTQVAAISAGGSHNLSVSFSSGTRPGDSTAPNTTAVASSAPNAQGWNRTDVVVRLTATDEEGGSGVKEISYALSGAQAGESVVADGAASISVSAEGITNITYFATDNAGNKEAAKTLAVKIDKTAPVFVRCVSSPQTLWPPNHRLVDVTFSVALEDALSGAAGFILRAAASNEPDEGLGDGDTPNDIQGFEVDTSDTSGRLRAERSGRGQGRVYRLTYEGADAAGNTSACQVTVTVPHERSRGWQLFFQETFITGR